VTLLLPLSHEVLDPGPVRLRDALLAAEHG
jgi:hypothetical protein